MMSDLSMQWLDRLPWPGLLLVAVLLGMAPYPMQPEPHLLEKLRMLFRGDLILPLDWFDLFLHATPLILVGLKAYRSWAGGMAGG